MTATVRDPSLGAPVNAAHGVLVLSPARLRDLSDCPRRYFLRWVLELSAESTDPHGHAADGQQLHVELQARHADPDRHDDPGPVDLHTARDPSLVRRALVHSELCPSTKGATYLGGEVTLRWYVARKAMLVTGRVDAMWQHTDGSIEVRDYKARGCPESLDDDRAAAIYALLALASHPDVSSVTVAYEALGREEPGLVSRAADSQWLRATYNTLVDTADTIRSTREFRATPSTWVCGSCGYRGLCPEAMA